MSTSLVRKSSREIWPPTLKGSIMPFVVLGRAEAVDAGDGGDDDDVARLSRPPMAERRRRSISSLMRSPFSM
jgi:hypothetical protein